MTTSKKIAVLGLGAMGSRMAARLIDAGHDVAVTNRTGARAAPFKEKGATVAATPRAAAEGREVVIACVRDDDAARAAWLDAETGALAALTAGAVAVESSTLTPACVRELAAAAEARGVAFLDAPVVGTRPQAEGGQLIYLVGGAEEALEGVRPVLEVLGGAIHHTGGTGTGALMKLAVNALFGIQVAAVAELLAMLGKAGIDPSAAMGILAAMPVISPAARGAAGLIVAGNHAPLFPIELVDKDLGYVQDAAAAAGAEVPTSAAVRAVFARARNAGHGELNITGVARLFE